MATLSDMTSSKFNILAYGQPMSGKTRFIGTILRALSKLHSTGKSRAYIFNCDTEDNLLPLRLLFPDIASQIDYDQYTGPEGYEAMLKKVVALRKDCPYDLVVVENGGQFHRMIFDYIMKVNGRTDADGARIQDWGLASERVKVRLKEILALQACVYVTFHQQIEKDEIFGRATGKLLVPGKFLPDEVPPMFNMFLHFMVSAKVGGEPDYWIQCATDNLWPAGDKTAALNFRESPDFEAMLAKITKAKEGLAKKEEVKK